MLDAGQPTIIQCFFNVLHTRSKNSFAGIDRFCFDLRPDQNAVMHGAEQIKPPHFRKGNKHRRISDNHLDSSRVSMLTKY